MAERHRARSGSPYEARYGFSRVVRHGRRVAVAGTAPIPPGGGHPPDGAYEQMMLCGRIAVAALDDVGASVSDVIRTRMYITDVRVADDVGRAHFEVFGSVAPASTMVVVAGLLDPAWLVEIEVDAVVGD